MNCFTGPCLRKSIKCLQFLVRSARIMSTVPENIGTILFQCLLSRDLKAIEYFQGEMGGASRGGPPGNALSLYCSTASFAYLRLFPSRWKSEVMVPYHMFW